MYCSTSFNCQISPSALFPGRHLVFFIPTTEKEWRVAFVSRIALTRKMTTLLRQMTIKMILLIVLVKHSGVHLINTLGVFSTSKHTCLTSTVNMLRLFNSNKYLAFEKRESVIEFLSTRLYLVWFGLSRQTGSLAITMEAIGASDKMTVMSILVRFTKILIFSCNKKLLANLQLATSSAPSKAMTQEAYLWHSLEGGKELEKPLLAGNLFDFVVTLLLPGSTCDPSSRGSIHQRISHLKSCPHLRISAFLS